MDPSSWQLPHCEGKAMRAWFKIKTTMTTSSTQSIQVLLRLNQALVIPIATYGSEVWGESKLKPSQNLFSNWAKEACNFTPIKMAKSLLSLPKHASNIGALSELGIYSLTVSIYSNMYKFYLRLKDMPPNRILYAAYKEDCKLPASWSAHIAHIHRFYFYYWQPSTFTTGIFKSN